MQLLYPSSFYHALPLLILSLYKELRGVSAQSLLPPSGQDSQCVGKLVDMSRLQRLSSDDEDVATFLERRLGAFDQTDGDNSNNLIAFAARDVHAVLTHDSESSGGRACLGERHRVRELVRGIPVFGADFVVRTNSCSEITTGSMDRSEYLNTNTLAALDVSNIRSIDGYRSTEVNIPTGYTAKRSKEEAMVTLSNKYGVAHDKVSDLELEIYPAENQDYLAWIGTLLVETTPGQPFVYHVVMDDDDGSIILQCDIDGFGSVQRQEKLQNRQRRLQDTDGTTPVDTSMCTSCSEQNPTINWNYNEIVECEVQTLYLNNTGRTSLCISGTDADGNTRFGPGPVDQYFWEGTYNCFGQPWCTFSPVPDCPDALSDVQFNAVYYLQYLQQNLGMMGGLSKDAKNPIPVTGKAHYEWEFCNAFYTPADHTVHFGDCDCELWSPLVSTDVVVHEITHGLTAESSNLLYFMQPGGLNEAYCDIMACAIEFTLDDSKDQPDFSVGESLGGRILRDMENPSSDGNSIDDFCMYEGAMRVHYASGFLNRAYVSAVMRCEDSCGATLSECAILMSNMFMYTNLESLSRLSDFKDAAKHTTRNVEEFFKVHNPTTSCSVEQVTAATIAGFSAVGLEVDEDNFRVRITCERRNWFIRFGEQCSNFWAIIKQAGSIILGGE